MQYRNSSRPMCRALIHVTGLKTKVRYLPNPMPPIIQLLQLELAVAVPVGPLATWRDAHFMSQKATSDGENVRYKSIAGASGWAVSADAGFASPAAASVTGVCSEPIWNGVLAAMPSLARVPSDQIV